MTQRKPRDLAASVRERLLQRARKQGEDFQAVLTKYCLERLLYRLSESPHCQTFVLKGALLFTTWSNRPHRPTKDLDLLGRGENSIERLEHLFHDLCDQPVEEDGLTFQAQSVRAQRIKEDDQYEGIRVRCEVRLGSARIQLQIDVGFGDAVTPGPISITYPTLLSFPAPSLLAYPRETVVAEKFQAMILLGIANSRMKDFYDLWVLAREFAFQGPSLSQAIRATFERRRTNLPSELPVALSATFSADKDKRRQWQAFLRKNKLLADDVPLDAVITLLNDFLMPPMQAAGKDEPFDMIWPAGGPWKPLTGDKKLK